MRLVGFSNGRPFGYMYAVKKKDKYHKSYRDWDTQGSPYLFSTMEYAVDLAKKVRGNVVIFACEMCPDDETRDILNEGH